MEHTKGDIVKIWKLINASQKAFTYHQNLIIFCPFLFKITHFVQTFFELKLKIVLNEYPLLDLSYSRGGLALSFSDLLNWNTFVF